MNKQDWTAIEDERLKQLFKQYPDDLGPIAKQLHRSISAVAHRLARQGLMEQTNGKITRFKIGVVNE